MIEETNITLDESIGLRQGKPLYKYIKRCHANSLLNEGILRIGTLYDYRKTEKYGTVIGDNEEGISRIYDDVNYDFSKPEELPPIAHEVFNIKPHLKNSYAKNFRIIVNRQSINYYLYCMSEIAERTLLDDFGCDCILEIVQPLDFIHSINNELNKLSKIKGKVFIMKCIYRESLMDHANLKSKISPCLLKEKTLKNQREVRAIWTPQDANIEPIMISCKNAKQYLREI